MSHDFCQYAELWQEQIDPQELAALQDRAKNFDRNARRKRLLDLALWLLAIGMVCMFLWSNPTSLQIRLGFVPLVAAASWFLWRRHQITRASRVIAVDDPRLFFDTAIRNGRAEISLSTLSLCLGLPLFVATVLLVKAAQGIDGIDWFRRLPRDINSFGVVIFAILFVSYVWVAVDNIKLREQLRRLETLRREWDDQHARDLAEGA